MYKSESSLASKSARSFLHRSIRATATQVVKKVLVHDDASMFVIGICSEGRVWIVENRVIDNDISLLQQDVSACIHCLVATDVDSVGGCISPDRREVSPTTTWSHHRLGIHSTNQCLSSSTKNRSPSSSKSTPTSSDACCRSSPASAAWNSSSS